MNRAWQATIPVLALALLPATLAFPAHADALAGATVAASPMHGIAIACAAAGCIAWLMVLLFLPPKFTRNTITRDNIALFPIMFVTAWLGVAVFVMSGRFTPVAPVATGALSALAYMPPAIMVYRWRRRIHQGANETSVLLLMLSAAVGALFLQSLVKLVNAGAEASAPRAVPGVITKIEYGSGKRGTYITLAGPAAALKNTGTNGLFDVSQKDADASAVGRPVCVVVHTGRLHLEWWELKPCPGGR